VAGALFALFVACTPFSSKDAPSTADAAAPVAGVDAGTEAEAAAPGGCVSHTLEDHFERPSGLGPWASSQSPSEITFTGSEMQISTGAPDDVYLASQLYSTPKSIHCTFRVEPLKAIASSSANPVDFLIIVLHQATGQVQLHVGLEAHNPTGSDPNTLRIRDDHDDATGQCVDKANTCPATTSDSPGGALVGADEWTTLDFRTDFHSATFTDNNTTAQHDGWDFGPIDSVEIRFGFENASPYSQAAKFDDLVCTLDC
jgi:hypothetical protein